jgi:hypothetical protein
MTSFEYDKGYWKAILDISKIVKKLIEWDLFSRKEKNKIPQIIHAFLNELLINRNSLEVFQKYVESIKWSYSFKENKVTIDKNLNCGIIQNEVKE